MKTLSGAAQDGPGSAALPSWQRSDRATLFTRRTRNLTLISLVAGLIGLIGVRSLVPVSASNSGRGDSPAYGATSADFVTPTPMPSDGEPYSKESAGGTAEYAIAAHELRGLLPDAAAGTELDLWVAWDDAYSKGPQIQRLVRSATLVRFVEPITREGARVVVLAVPERSIGRLMYGDLYGSLSSTVPSP